MNVGISRRVGRRLIAMGAGSALVAAGLSLGAMAPAHAASVVTGGLTDGLGNPVSGSISVYRQGASGSFTFVETIDVGSNGYVSGTLTDGVYKLSFRTGAYTEFFKDKADLASADVLTVAGNAPVALGAWTIDQPYVVGRITNAAGKPLTDASVVAYDAASGDEIGGGGADEKGNIKLAVPNAPVKVRFSAPGYAAEFFNDKGTLEAAEPIAPTAAGANVGTVVLGTGGMVSGQVTSDAGAPLEFIRVSVGGSSDLTDKSGGYTVKSASTGSQTVRFSDPVGEYRTEFFNNAADITTATPVTIGAGQLVGNINANMTPLPADPSRTVEVTGSVKDSLGAPVVGAEVTATTTPATTSQDRRNVETVYTNRRGVYAFTELDKVQGENQFNVFADADEQGDDDAFDLFGTWFGGVQNYERSPAVAVTPGTPVGAVDFVLDRAGGISGSVTGLAGAPLEPGVRVLSTVDGLLAFASAEFEADSTFESRSLRPGTYKVRFDDNTRFHAGEWWKDKAKVDDAVVVTIKAGQLVSGLNAVLGNNLAASERPEIEDYPWVGKALAADSGVWNLQTGTAFSYEWLVGTTVVGKGDTFTPTAANIGDRLSLRVTAQNGRLVGSAVSSKSAKIGYQPKVKVKVRGSKATLQVKANPVKAKKVRGKVVIKEIVKVKDDGTIKYEPVAKAKIKKGKGTASLGKLKRGKHKLVFFFTGRGKVGSNDETVKVKVKR